ncbi:MAG: alternative ribosome rescue aminoacyl-tRNA hydrolase ArfB [Solirubrobacterales bacterium]
MSRVTETQLIVSRSVSLPLTEIEVKSSRSSGPGGQHANKTESRVEASFSVLGSETLSDGQKRRVSDRIGPVVRAVSQDARSQMRNREIALIRLGDKLEEALKVRRRRVATKPTGAAKAQRLSAKRARGETKAMRRKPGGDE